MQFAGLQKTSLIDFPDRIATVLFTPRCNLRCPFCYNWRLVLEPKEPFLQEKDVFHILESRRRFVEAVAITGGEPTLQPDLPQFLSNLKQRGFATKVDTNGFFPDVLERCLPYLNYIAVDVKTCPERYVLLGAKNTSNFLRTIELVKQEHVDYEFRCTAVPEFVEESDIPKIGELVKGSKRFVFQQFIPGDTLEKTFNTVKPYTSMTITRFAGIMERYVDEVILRI